MKKYIAITLVLFLSFFLCGCVKKKEIPNDLKIIKERGYIIVGVKNDSAPFGFYNKEGKLVGMDIDIAYAIAQRIFNEKSYANVKFVIVDAQNRISKLNSKEVDILVATMSINEKRKLILDFSMPYFVAKQKVLIRKTSKIPNLQYFNKNGRIAVVMGSIGEKIVRLTTPNANLIGTKNYIEAYNLLINNKVDAILGDDCILSSFLNGNTRLLGNSYSSEFYAVAVRKSENSKELLNSVNATLAELLDEKQLNLIKKKWILY